MNLPLILASSSAPRRELLTRLRLPFQVIVPDVDETPYPEELPLELVRRLSELKARKIAEQFPHALIIAGDQVGVCEDEIMCKPGNYDNAVKQLQKLSANQVTFHAGICLLNAAENRLQMDVVDTYIQFRALTPVMIDHYLRDEKPYHCAGTLMLEQLGISLVEKSQSDDPTAIMGLPLIALTSMLMNEGVDVLGEGVRVFRCH